MSRPPRFLAPLLLALTALGASPASLGDEAENLRQLEAMPRERRIALSENLKRFDKLDPAERAAIRKLDAEIARNAPVEQARYRSLLRQYHLWVNGLTEEQKEQLKQAQGTEARFALARKFRIKEKQDGTPSPIAFGVRSGDFGMRGPYEVAYLLKIWQRLTPNEKLDIERKTPRKRLIDDLKAMHKSKGVTNQPFPEAEEKHYLALLARNEAFKKEMALPKGKNAKDDEFVLARRMNELRLAEFLYFQEHKPKAVSQAHLERFSASCPNWLHDMIDPLSPDDARAYLTILYRLLYPEPGEMPAEAKPAKSQAAPRPSGEKKSGPGAPL
jgi:hypothetical protein